MLNISSRRHCTLFAKKGVCTCDFAERRTTGEIVPNMRTSKIALITATVILTVTTGCNGFFLSENDLDSVSISPTNVFLDPGVTLQFYVTGTTVGGDSVDESANATWTSSNAQVATIDSSGLLTAISSEGTVSATTVKVTAVTSGSATITATATLVSGTLTSSTTLTVS